MGFHKINNDTSAIIMVCRVCLDDMKLSDVINILLSSDPHSLVEGFLRVAVIDV